MPPQLPTRRLGSKGPEVCALGLGLMGISAWYGTPEPDSERFKVLDRAYELGQNFWDSSDSYKDSEELIGKWFKRTGKRDEIFVATKFGNMTDGERRFQDSSPEHARKACEKSLGRLGVECIDLYYCHRVDRVTPIEETVRAMVELKNEGKIKYLGLSEISADTLRRACKVHHIDAVQLEFSPFAMDIEDPKIGLLATCRELGVATIAYSPLGRGILTGVYKSPDDFEEGDFRKISPRFSAENFPKNLELTDKIVTLAKKKGCTPGQLTLAWELAQGDDIIPIPGTKKIKYLEENLGALNVTLTKEDDQEIRAAIENAEVTGDRYPLAMMNALFADTPPLKVSQLKACERISVNAAIMTDRENSSVPTPSTFDSLPNIFLHDAHMHRQVPYNTPPKERWMYKTFTFGNYDIWYASPHVQLVMVAIVCFLCPGMFNALGGLGGGGQYTAKPADNANSALYSTFSVVGFFAGTFTNVMGVKLALSFGGFGYCIYTASFLTYSHTDNDGFVIFAGALVGVCAGLLWTAQGAIMMSYPAEGSKGKYISWFWSIFNLGAVIGSLIPLAQNFHTESNSTVSDGTYIGFIVLMCSGAVLALFLCDADKVQRSNGSRVILMKNPTWSTEVYGLWYTLKSDIYILLLFPMFFASNWFYTYQFNGVNGAHFNTRTRALNNTLYWLAQIAGAFTAGFTLDTVGFRRSVKAKAALLGLLILTCIIWGGGYAYQVSVPSDRKTTSNPNYQKMDWTDKGYVGPMFLYIFYGFYDAAWQLCVYWFMGALSNSGRKTANFAGFYKGIQSAGAAIIWRIDALNMPYLNEFISTWCILAGALIVAAPAIFWKIKDTVPIEEDLRYTDENVGNILPMTTKRQSPVPSHQS
ncbi:hypothetical protein B7494_g8553 [Chlorociboria aeruginascens]|nr:hypothetical protein B7494_g8553 [Chlorociboria aeruginascens]